MSSSNEGFTYFYFFLLTYLFCFIAGKKPTGRPSTGLWNIWTCFLTDDLTWHFKPIYFWYSLVTPSPVAFFPLSGVLNGADISPYKNPSAKLVNIRPATGPDGLPSGAIKFSGRRRNNYVFFQNSGKLDTINEITLIVWVKPKSEGPIFHYKPESWGGVHLWLVGKPGRRKWFVRFSSRSGKKVPAIRSSHVKMGRWNYLAVTYRKGLGSIWIDGIPVAQVRHQLWAIGTRRALIISSFSLEFLRFLLHALYIDLLKW